MAHCAKLDENNVVIEVNVVDNKDVGDLPFPESETVGIEFLNNWAGEVFNWKQTSYNGNFRKNYAGPGFTYNEEFDAFLSPKPFASWKLNKQYWDWEAPVAFPDDGENHHWDEKNLSWIILNPEE